MTNRLPSNFELDRYGLHCRLVNEGDAEFIVKLRTDPVLSRYIHATDANVDKQKEWIRKYKKREAAGEDYYFMFEYNGQMIGVYRIAEINSDGTFMCGSWLFRLSKYKFASLAAFIIVHEIAFDIIDLEKENDYVGTHVENKSALSCKTAFGFENTGERIDDCLGKFITAKLTKDSFYSNKTKIEHFLLK